MAGTQAAGISDGVVKVRVMGDPKNAEAVAGKIVDALETEGYQVIEWTKPHSCQAPDESKSKVFITALANDGK